MPTPLPSREPTPAVKGEQTPVSRRVLEVIPKAADLEVHLSVVAIGGVSALEVRDFVPSTGFYGRGTTLPWNAESLKLVKAGAREAERISRA